MPPEHGETTSQRAATRRAKKTGVVFQYLWRVLRMSLCSVEKWQLFWCCLTFHKMLSSWQENRWLSVFSLTIKSGWKSSRKKKSIKWQQHLCLQQTILTLARCWLLRSYLWAARTAAILAIPSDEGSLQKLFLLCLNQPQWYRHRMVFFPLWQTWLALSNPRTQWSFKWENHL